MGLVKYGGKRSRLKLMDQVTMYSMCPSFGGRKTWFYALFLWSVCYS